MSIIQKCPTGSINSFPLQLGLTATDALYDGVSEPVTIDFQWATRSTSPQFITPKTSGVTDEVGAGNSNLSTLRFMNNNYTVASVQIINASHKSWILPVSDQVNNMEDIVITFSNESLAYPYIVFIIPVLRTPSQIQPNYLAGLVNSNSNGPFSLQSCFPSNPRSRFAYYATCLNGNTATAQTQNMYVFISTDGIRVLNTLMTQILAASGNKTNFLAFSSPFNSRLTATSKSITSISDFSNYVQTTTQLNNFADFKQYYPGVSQVDTSHNDINAYKCVNIDPDTAIVDGQIQVDLDTGELLPDVLAKRDVLRAAHNVTGGMNPGRFEKYMGTALGIILSIVLFAVILWLIIFVFMETGSGSYLDGFSALESPFLIMLPSYLLTALITGFVGFIIGAMLN